MVDKTFTFEEALQPSAPETFSFEDALGISSPTAPTPEDQSVWRQVADIPVGVAMGAARGTRGIIDVFGANNALSRSIRGVEEYLDGLLSAQAKKDQQEIGRIMQEAEDKGVGDQIKAALEAFTVAPVDLIAQALGTAAPNLLVGLKGRLLGYGTQGARYAMGATGAAMGTGIVKGEIYEAVKEEVSNAGFTPEEAERIAQQAQSYGGGNLDQLVLGGILGAASASTGIERAIIPGLTGKISEKLAKKGFGKFAQTVTGEALTEAIQGGQEQFAQNVALQREGFDVPTWRGVVGQATLEGVTGGGLGAGVGALTGGPERVKADEPPTATEERLQQLAQEQQSAEYMREIEQREFEERQRSIGRLDERTGQYALNLPRGERAAPTTSVQGTPLPATQRGFDLFGRPLREEAITEPSEVTSAATPITEQLDATLDLTALDLEEGQLKNRLSGLERTKANKPEADAIRTRLSQIKDLKSGIDELVLTPPKAVKGKPAKPDTVLTNTDLVNAGLPKVAGYVKQLSGLDMAEPNQRTKAAGIIGAALNNPRVTDETKAKLQALYQQKVAAPVAEAQQTFDFETAMGVAPDITPSSAITQESFDAMGIGKNAVIRKNDDLLSADLSDPAQLQFVRNALETYRDAPNRSDSIKEKIDAFLNTLPPAPEAVVVPEATPTVGGFKTEKGSTYVIDGQGRTARTKKSEGRGQGTTYEPHPVLYVSAEDSQKILEEMRLGSVGGRPSTQLGYVVNGVFNPITDTAQLPTDGNPVVIVRNKSNNTVSGVYPAKLQPEVGLAPIEKLYKDDGTSSTHVGNKIVELFAPQTPEVTPDVTPTPTPAAEPAPIGQPSEPSVDMVGVGDGPAAPQESAPGAVPEPAVGGLADPTARTEPDARRVQPAQPTVAPEPDQLQQLIEDNLDTLARKDDLTLADVLAAAANARLDNRITREDMQLIAEAETAQEALTDLEIAVEAAKNDVVRAVEVLQSLGESAGAVTPALTTAILNGDVQGGLQAIIDDTSGVYSGIETLVARNILDRRVALPSMRVVDSLGVDNNGTPILGQYDSVNDEVSLVRGTFDSHTFLHELVHAFVHRTIVQQELSGARRSEFRDLQDVFNFLTDNHPELAKQYGMESLTEFASEVMSNRDFQMRLMGIEYKKQSAFSWFARAIRKLFGLDDSGPIGNTLFTAIVAVDGLMRDGRSFQLDTLGQRFGDWNIARVVQTVDTPLGKPLPSTFAEVAVSPDPVYRSEARKFLNTAARSEIPLADIVRQQTVDQFAPIARKVSEAFSQGVRSAFGDVNPMVWIRQAYDHSRIALQVFNKGGIRMDENGLWEAFDLKDKDGKPVSPKAIVQLMQAFGEKQDMSYPQVKARVATLLESMRLKSLRDHNAKIEALAREKALAGDIDGAFETRQEKFPLHKTNAEIDADVAIFDATPEVQEIQRMMNAVRGNIIDAMVKSGRISAEQGQSWKDVIDYVPFDRLQDVMVNPEILRVPGRRGLAVLSKIPEFRGSYARPVSNTIDNFMNRIATMTADLMKNSAVVRTLDYMVDAGMARRVASKSDADNSNFVLPTPVYKDGKPVLYEMQNQYDLAAFIDTPEIKSSLIKALGGASRVLRTTITATPMFAIKQVIDDSQRVIFNSGVDRPFMALARTLYNFPKIWWAQARGNDTSYMRRMEALGIAGEFDYNPINPLSTLEADTRAVPRSPIRALIHAMEQGARASDMAARLAVYEQTMKESNDPLLAQQRARELINFNRRGSSKSMRAIVHVVPFFNSWAQGLDLMYRGMTGADAPSGMAAAKARRMFLGRVGTMAALSTLYAFAMGDDEYYQEQSDDVRDRNWLLPKQISDALGLKQPIKITVPNEFGYLFKSIPERVLQYWREHARGEQRDASDVFIDAVKAIGGEYLAMPIPAAIKPLLENTVNYSTFTGRPLVPDTLKQAPKPLQYTSATSELAKSLGKATDQSPILIDNFIRGYFGMVGGAITVVSDGLLNPSRPDRGPEQLPFLSIGLVAPVGTRTRDEFYRFREQVTEAVQGARLIAERDPNSYDAYVRKNGHLLEAARYVNNHVKYLDRIRATRKAYETDPSMTGEQKREALIQLRKDELEVLSSFRELRTSALKQRQ
jgi:hypothetical protein